MESAGRKQTGGAPSSDGAALRILFVVHGFPPESRGGTESYCLEAARALHGLGHDVHVLAGSMSGATPPDLVPSTVEGVPVLTLRRQGLFVDDWDRSDAPDAEALFRQALARLRPDVVHVHHWIRLTRTLVATSHTEGIPALATLHDLWATCPRCFRIREGSFCRLPLGPASCLTCVPRLLDPGDAVVAGEIEQYRDDFAQELRLARRLIVPSGAHRDLVAALIDEPPGRLLVLPHGTIGQAPVGAGMARPSGAGATVRLGFWGDLVPMKGYHLLLEALRSLPAEQAARFEVHGWGETHDPAYADRLDELERGLSVHRHGAFVPADLASVPLDWAVIPSVASESYSFVLDEALLLGVPPIVSDRGALAERIGSAGLSFEPEQAAALAGVLERVLAEPGLRDRLARSLPSPAPMEGHARRLLELYREVLAEGGDPPRGDPELDRRRHVGLAARLDRLDRRALNAAGQMEAEAARARGLAAELRRAEESVRESAGTLATYERSLAEHRIERERLQAELEQAGAWLVEARDLLARREATVRDQGAALEALASQAERDAELEAKREADREELAERLQSEAQALRSGLTRDVARCEALETRLDDLRGRLADLAVSERSASESAKAWRGALEELAAARERHGGELDEALEACDRVAGERDAAVASARRAEARVTGLEAGLAVREEDVRELTHRLRERVASERDLAERLQHALREQALRRAERDRYREDLRAARARAEELAGRAAGSEASPGRGTLPQAVRQDPRSARPATIPDRVSGPESVRAAAGPGPGLRILMVVHQFLPNHAAGSEIYTWKLSKGLAARHHVHLLFTEARYGVHQYQVREGTWDDLPYTEVSHQQATRDFELTYRDERMNAIFRQLLEQERPDVVHIQHLHNFSIDFISIAKAAGIPVVYTLHEYMLLCPRGGQMLRADGERCARPIPEKCADCIDHYRLGAPDSGSGQASLVSRIGRYLPQNLRLALRSLLPREERTETGPAQDREAWVHAAAERLDVVREALRGVDLFIAPSRFLRGIFIDSGMVEPGRILYSDYGMDPGPLSDLQRIHGSGLRVGYIGTIAPYKGVHVLIEAMNALVDREDVSCQVHGALETFPDYALDVQDVSRNPRTVFHGRYDNRRIGEVLGGLDVLVVPSLWYENAPLTIHEAYLAGIPVVASRLGGMAEYVHDGVTGLLFETGDAVDLADRLRTLAEDPSRMDRFDLSAVPVKPIDEDALEMAARYRSLVEAARGAATIRQGGALT